MNPIDLVDLFRRELALCKVQGQKVAVLTGPRSRSDYAAALMAAGQQLGAEVFRIDLPAQVNATDGVPTTAQGALWGRTPLTGHRVGVELLKMADIVVDLIGLLHSPEQLEVQRAGTRVLMIVEPPDVLSRMFPRPNLRARVEAGGKRLAKADTLRVANPAGTDITYKLGQYSRTPILQYGYTDEPGRWDHFPGGFVYTWPNEGEANGTIVLREGDIIFPFKEYVRSNIHIDVKDGAIWSIRGGFDADHLKHFMDSWKDPDAYAMAHIGWGLDEMALWNAISLMNKETAIGQDGRAFYGNVLWSTGPNTDVGGSRDTPAHLDIAMRGADLFLDNEPIVLAGEVVPEDMRA
ncbi:MAG TPA: 2,5-dihydroxypyridine 5,6-dioxygenase [Hyphomicrobiaceae bacterium]